MPTYEYRCAACDTRFEAKRPMAEADADTSCPEGHPGARRLLSVFATSGRASGPAPAPAAAAPMRGCGGGCACH